MSDIQDEAYSEAMDEIARLKGALANHTKADDAKQELVFEQQREIESLRSLVTELGEAVKKTTSVYRHPEVDEDELIRRAEEAVNE